MNQKVACGGDHDGGEEIMNDKQQDDCLAARKRLEEPTKSVNHHHRLATTSGKENHSESQVKQSSSTSFAEIDEQRQQQQQHQQCHACNRPLAKSKHLVSVSGQSNQWHSECFRCNICQMFMDKEVSCHIYREKILCREDYLKLQRDLTTKCSRCSWPIGASDWVRRASQYVYHLACFSCDICQRQLSTGEQFTIRIQKKNVVRLLCRLHFAIEQMADKCHGGQLKGPSCAAPTRGQSNDDLGDMEELQAANRDQILRADTQTTKCTLNMTTSHVESFEPAANEERYLHLLASTSGQQQQADQRVSFFSEQHDETPAIHLLGVDATSRLFKSTTDHFQETISMNHHLQLQQIHQQQQQQLSNSRADANNTASSIASSESSINGGGNGNCHNLASLASKSKRVRTTFTEDQLSILQNHFQIDSNPDGQDLERIAVITGLTKRVTQVWFQNSRARQKKYMTKRKPNQLPQVAVVASNNSTPCSEMIQASQQHYQHHSQQQQRHDPSIVGGCFTAKMDELNPAAAAAHKWINMTAAGDNTMSPSLSSQDEGSRMDDLDESQSSSSNRDDDDSAIRNDDDDRSTDN